MKTGDILIYQAPDGTTNLRELEEISTISILEIVQRGCKSD